MENNAHALTGKVVIAVLVEMREGDRVLHVLVDAARPHDLVVAPEAAVDGLGAEVLGHGEPLAVELELAVA